MLMPKRRKMRLASLPRASTTAAFARRRPCWIIARRRAQNLVRKRHLPGWLVVVMIMVMLMPIAIDNLRQRLTRQKARHASQPNFTAALNVQEGTDVVSQGKPIEKIHDAEDGTEHAVMAYRPPADFQSKHLVQILASLIRNRGRPDNSATRLKWQHLDHFALALAVYLREIQAKDGWRELEKEIRALKLGTVEPERLARNSLSIHHSRILALVPSWRARGEELLSLVESVPSSSTEHSAGMTPSGDVSAGELPDSDEDPDGPKKPVI